MSKKSDAERALAATRDAALDSPATEAEIEAQAHAIGAESLISQVTSAFKSTKPRKQKAWESSYWSDRHKHSEVLKITSKGKSTVNFFGCSRAHAYDQPFDGLIVCLLGDEPPELPIGSGDPGWARALQKYCNIPRNYLSIDWPDQSAPPVGHGFFKALYDQAVKKKIRNVLFFCEGGHGRTGTALAATYIELCGVSAKDAIKYVRKVYCKKAVESEEQEDYLKQIAGKED